MFLAERFIITLTEWLFSQICAFLNMPVSSRKIYYPLEMYSYWMIIIRKLSSQKDLLAQIRPFIHWQKNYTSLWINNGNFVLCILFKRWINNTLIGIGKSVPLNKSVSKIYYHKSVPWKRRIIFTNLSL
jgi:hypothetical protein